jgi:magnesium transporter
METSPGRRNSDQLDSHSHHSSPRPESELNLPDSRQIEQDRHLAHSMAATAVKLGPRARSNTIRERDRGGSGGPEVVTPQRATSSGTVPTHHESRRRPSVSIQDNPTDAMGHLADDLAREDREEEAQREQEEQAYFDREGRRDEYPRPQHHTPVNSHRSAAAARLYRHHRNVSDSSIDSQGGAYIDHRRQPHSLSLNVTTPRGQTRGSERVGFKSSGRKGSALRRFDGSDDELSRSPTSPSAIDADPSVSAFSARTARQAPFSSRDLDENAIEDAGPSSPRPVHFLDRHSSQKSYTSLRSQRRDSDEQTSAQYGADMSRPGSQFGKPEDDICFPAHGAAAEMDFVDEDHPHADDLGIPGVLPNFPYPFDFSALEDFAVDERQGMPMGRRRRTQGTMNMGSAASPPDYGVSSATQGAGRFGGTALSSSSENEVPRMGGGRHRKLSESVHPGRYRRKLAQFEGNDEDREVLGASPDRTAGGPSTFVNILDTKTPLLADKRAPSGYGAAGPPPTSARAPGGPRPYRFSFYSNALPSTIHARSLAELPAEGQSFEELFVGRQFTASPATAGEQDEETGPITSVGLDARLAELRSSGGTAHGAGGSGVPSGASTPSGASWAKAAKNGNAFPAGIAAAAGALRGERARQAVMRSDDDAEANTWWLDVMCPTDQEMKALSKVRLSPFSPFLPGFSHSPFTVLTLFLP